MSELIQHLNGHYDGVPSNGTAKGRCHPGTDLQVALSRVTHDINNPLSIISGNAQLLLELAQVLDLDPDVAKPIRDIEEASQQLAHMIERLNVLNDAAQQRGNGLSGE